ncbi:hypothetical protein chiPu_0016220 [Chiloscyllium punctatum]|uniref:Uncharacterized protein n=1 Tax=Chiloscyllium punctatum TaxID=137246 RepID=A0A401T542_CHIPU|nr:hypothetical protein [Chiloscyllium punctatum]
MLLLCISCALFIGDNGLYVLHIVCQRREQKEMRIKEQHILSAKISSICSSLFYYGVTDLRQWDHLDTKMQLPPCW